MEPFKILAEKLLAGAEGGTMRVVYTDGTLFDYFHVPLATFAAIVRAKSPGQKLLVVRDRFTFNEVS